MKNSNNIKCPYCDEDIDKASIRCEYCDELIKKDYKIVNNPLINNSYHILGLDPASSQKQISKRAKDILKYLAIGEIPDFENDFYFTTEYRNEIFVKSALDSLSHPKDKLINTFFWFDIESDEEKTLFQKYNNKDYNEAISLLEESENKKNLAILYILLLLDPNIDSYYSEYVDNSLDLFKEIYEDDKFWKKFEKKYLLFDDISTNKDLIDELRKDLGKHLSNIYYDISFKLGDDSILKKFHKYFKNSKGNKANEQVEKIYLDLGKLSGELEKMNISEDGVFDDDEKRIVKKNHHDITELLNKLKDLGLYDDSKTLLIRDTVAEAFRTIMLDLNNELSEEDEALKVLNYALDIVGTDGLKHKINEEYKTITANIKLKPVIQLLEDEDFVTASNKIEELENENLSNEDKNYLNNLKKRAIFGRLGKGFIEGKELFKKEDYSKAVKYFSLIEELAQDNVELFEGIDPEALDNLITGVRGYLEKINKGELKAEEVFEYIDELRAKILKQLSEEDGYFFIFYIDSITYGYISNIHAKPKSSQKPFILFTIWGVGVSIYGDTTYFTFLWMPLAPINTWDVQALGNGQYQFYGKKDMPGWKKIWRVIGWFFIISYLIAILGAGSSGNSNYNSNYSNNSTNSTVGSNSYDNSSIDFSSNNSINNTNKKIESNNCILNNVSYIKPTNSHCTVNDKYNAWKCDTGYNEKNNYCWCTSGNYSCPTYLDTSYLDNKINTLEKEISNMYVNQYSDSSVNNYNYKVNSMNKLIEEKNKKLNESCSCK